MYKLQEEARLHAVASAQPHPTTLTFDADSAYVIVESTEFPQFRTDERLTLQQIQDAQTRRNVEDMIKHNNSLISDRVNAHKKQLAESAKQKAQLLARGRR